MSKKTTDKFYKENAGLNTRVSVHDRYHIEIKSSYSLDRTVSKHVYRYDMYLFIPQQLGFNSSTYKSNDFFIDSKMYSRLEALSIKLPSLANPKYDGPLRRIEEARRSVSLMLHQEQVEVCHAAKLFAASLTNAARQHLLIIKQLDEAGKHPQAVVQAKSLLTDVLKAIEAYDRVLNDFLSPMCAPLIRKTFMVIRSYMSFEVEVIFGKLFNAVKDATEITDEIALNIESERKVRMDFQKQWALLMSDKSNKKERENIWYDYSIFKKIVTSCLHLNENESRLTWTLSEIMMSLAAAIAMAFALAVAVISTQEYSMNSLPWLIIAVLAYMFKDRIKEYMRSVGVSAIQPFVPDRKIFLSTVNDGKRVGVMTDKMIFPKLHRMDPKVKEIREHAARSVGMLMPGSEVVMRVSKQVTAGKSALYTYGKTRNVASIARFDVRRLLARMDDPMRVVDLIDTVKKQTVATKIPSVYHVPLLMRYYSLVNGKKEVSYQAMRLVLDRRGIRRLEPLEEKDREWAKISEWDFED